MLSCGAPGSEGQDITNSDVWYANSSRFSCYLVFDLVGNLLGPKDWSDSLSIRYAEHFSISKLSNIASRFLFSKPRNSLVAMYSWAPPQAVIFKLSV